MKLARLMHLLPGLVWLLVTVPVSAASFANTGSLVAARQDHTATLLPNGKVLVAGGTNGSALADAELYDPTSGKWAATGSLVSAREAHTATLLPNGKVLVAGGWGRGDLASAELYDPTNGTWTTTGSQATARSSHTATLLPNGKVLVVGGDNGASVPIASAELYDPASGTWTAAGSLATARFAHTATLLPSGKVLVAGGWGGSAVIIASAEIYDPMNGTWTTTADLASARRYHTATLLPNGKVLVAGGSVAASSLASAELFDPTSGTWTVTGGFVSARGNHTATLLPNGKVLATGGAGSGGALASAELYDPDSGTWATTGSLIGDRYAHTATLLPNGELLLAGGTDNSSILSSAETYDSTNGVWTAASSPVAGRGGHTSILLPNGKVLVTGGANNSGALASAELYDHATDVWTTTDSLAVARYGHTVTLLPNGKVLVTGGTANGGASAFASTEVYDPAIGTWAVTGSLVTARTNHTATLLPNGKVLVVGGYNGSYLASAELYDPANGTWLATGSLTTARGGHTATLLPNGKVLVAGGQGLDGLTILASAELYDPASGTWTATGSLTTAHGGHTATLLPNGKVLVAGGHNGFTVTAELYDPASGTWTVTGNLTTARYGHTTTLLPNGKVLVAGGNNGSELGSVELYDPASGAWMTTSSLNSARYVHAATLLPSGKVLVAGGFGGHIELANAELYDVGLGFAAGWQPQISSASLSGSGQVMLTGTGFTGIAEASGGSTNSSASNYPVVQVQRLANEQSRFLFSSAGGNWSATAFTSGLINNFPPGYALVTVFTNGIPSPSTIVNLATPHITVTGQTQEIADGDTAPRTSDGTDLGAIPVQITQIVQSFTIANIGSAPLHLTGSPVIAINGAMAGDFKVVTPPAALVDPGTTTTFAIAFQPKGPGSRNAAITIANDDPLRPGFTFAITGLGKLPTNYVQTITFAPPSTLYLGQSPFTLSASASSGLPVTFSLVTPIPAGASLAGNALTFTTAGIVKVQATCPASGNYNAATPVVKSITVKANPSALTLINLAQVYDGNPKPIGTLGGVGMPTITYKVGANYVSTPPTNAGSYAVRAVGSTTATGTLVIAKAPLTVTPDHQFKFAGRVNPALTFSYSGFVNGETAGIVATAPVLKTTATLNSPSGIYPITASGGAAANYSLVYMPASLVVASFAGSYEALLLDENSIPSAKLSITVAANASNSFTGKLYAGTEIAALPITGTLATNTATEQASSSVYLLNSNGIPYVINFTLPFALSSSVTASVTRDNAPLGSTSTGQRLSASSVNYAGTHTAILEPATPAGGTVPAGAGWATATISSTGVLTLTGKLGDDTSFTTALSPDIQSNPGYRLFAQPYLVGRTQSFIAGAFALAPHPTLTNRRYLAQQSLTWTKTGLAADVSYRTGFGPVSTVLMIDPWLPPVVGTSLAQRLGLNGTTFGVSHSATGSASHNNLPTLLNLSASNAVSVINPAANLRKWKTLTFVPTTGTFTGSFILSDPAMNRTVSFSGVLRQPATAPNTLIGNGSYVLPPLSGTEKTTGEIIFSK